jgi:UDP-glucose 4-epimerase
MATTYLITGGAGFIGTNLAHQLTDNGARVIVADDLSAGTDKNRLPLSVEFHEIDIRKTDELTDVMNGVDVVFHLAALPRVQFSIDEPQKTHDVNVNGTLSVLVAAKKAGVQRVVYAASSSAYGDQETLPLSEELPAQPKSPYALQKHFGEGLMKLWSEIYGLPTVSLRFFNAYGPHMDPDGAYALVVGKFLKMRTRGETLTIFGDGEQTRDFTHVSDIIDALVRASESESVGQGEVINTGAGRNITINALAELIGGDVEYLPTRLEPKHTRADIARAKELLGWEPKVVIEDGIRELKKEFGII